MTIDLPPEMEAALTERAAHSNLTVEQYVVTYLTNLLKPFDPYDDGTPDAVGTQEVVAVRP